MNSLTLFTGTLLLTTMMLGTIATRLTGAKSFTASHGSLRYRLGLMPCVPAVTISKV